MAGIQPWGSWQEAGDVCSVAALHVVCGHGQHAHSPALPAGDSAPSTRGVHHSGMHGPGPIAGAADGACSQRPADTHKVQRRDGIVPQTQAWSVSTLPFQPSEGHLTEEYRCTGCTGGTGRGVYLTHQTTTGQRADRRVTRGGSSQGRYQPAQRRQWDRPADLAGRCEHNQKDCR